MRQEFAEKRAKYPNPLNKFSQLFGFSQMGEDGILLGIFRRVGLRDGFFVEFGVGKGTENNSLISLACDWKGAWFGAEDLNFHPTESPKLSLEKVWITKDNALNLYKSTNENADLISLDLDGNDFYLVEEFLANGVPTKVFVVEYNSKLPPHVELKIDYDPNHKWSSDDYFGASLQSFDNLFYSFGYKLVCCS